MGNELKMAKQLVLQGFMAMGLSNRQIHKQTGIHRDTISRFRKQFQNRPEVIADFSGEKGQSGPKVTTDSTVDSPPSKVPATNSSSIVPYRQRICDAYGAGLTAQRIYQDLVEETSFSGSYQTVKRYVRKLRKTVVRFFEHLPTIPGREVQVDFGKAPCLVKREGKKIRPWLFKATLSFSGHSYEELVWKQDLETFLRCLEHTFQAFGGVAETVKLDNLKSGVLQACLFEPEIQPVFLAFSQHYGFMVNPCAPGRPEHKGRVERDVGYTKSNALKGRLFESLEQGNLFLRHWNKRWARTRIHGSSKMQVYKRFLEHERPRLKSLPDAAFAYFKVGMRKVDIYGHVEVEGSFYSVPHTCIGQKLVVHFNHLFIRVFEGGKLVAQHRPLWQKGRCSTLPGHKPAYSPLCREQAEGWQCQKAKAIGPSCHRLVYRILCSDHPMAIRKTRGILSLAKKYGGQTVERACQEALTKENYSYRAVAGYCEHAQANKSEEPVALTQEHELIRQVDFYQSLFDERTS